MEQLFHKGQRVICADESEVVTESGSIVPNNGLLIVGKAYTVDNPKTETVDGIVYIKLNGVDPLCEQELFVPEDFDRYADNEIHQALKGIPQTL